MRSLELAKEIDRRNMLGGPVRLLGGREYGASATGWYYSLDHSLDCIEDAVRSRGCGYNPRGTAQDNVSGPFTTRTSALRDLAEWIAEEDGREWAERCIREDDERIARNLQVALAAQERIRAKKRAKRARYAANRRARGLPVHRISAGLSQDAAAQPADGTRT